MRYKILNRINGKRVSLVFTATQMAIRDSFRAPAEKIVETFFANPIRLYNYEDGE